MTAEDSRSQWENVCSAKRKLADHLADELGRPDADATNTVRREQITTGERPAKQFTHNDQRGVVVCHESGTTWRMADFYRGRLDRVKGAA